MKVTELRLYTGVKIDENNVVKLAPADLLTSLNTYIVKTYTNLSLVLENFTLRIPENYFTIMQVNYMAFRENTNTRWFFARVEKLEYISDSVTEVKFTIDYWQTYYSEISLLNCFVEREVTATDVIGENTLEEGLPVERVIQLERHTESIQSSTDTMFWIGMFTDYDAEDDSVTATNITVYNSGFSGHNLVLFQILLDNTIPEGESSSPLADSIENIFLYILKANTSSNGSIEDIKDLFILPYSVVNQSRLNSHSFTVATRTGSYYTMSPSIGADVTDISFAKKSAFTDYTPKNNKCFCYPYNYLLLSNNAGNQNILKYEDFAGSNVTFQIQKAISIGCSIRVVPTNYKGQTIDYDEQIPCAKFPVCGWSADSYINWLTQNSLNLTSQLIGVAGNFVSAVNTAGGGMLLEAEGFEVGGTGALGQMTNAIQSALNYQSQFRKADLMPNIEGGSQNNGDVSFASDSNNFEFKMMRASLECLKTIDEYFSRFGYKVSRVKTPNIATSRLNHFYVQTRKGEKAVSGNIPKDGLDIINQQFSNGITIWKSLSGIGNYS